MSYQEQSCVMEKGDMLLLYSDGVTEAQSPSGEEFGEERLEGILRESRGDGVESLLAIVQAAVQSWTAGQPPADDITLVAARRAG